MVILAPINGGSKLLPPDPRIPMPNPISILAPTKPATTQNGIRFFTQGAGSVAAWATGWAKIIQDRKAAEQALARSLVPPPIPPSPVVPPRSVPPPPVARVPLLPPPGPLPAPPMRPGSNPAAGAAGGGLMLVLVALGLLSGMRRR